MQSIYVTPRGTTMRRTLVSLLDHDPDLGALLRDEREASARRDVQVERARDRRWRMEPGRPPLRRTLRDRDCSSSRAPSCARSPSRTSPAPNCSPPATSSEPRRRTTPQARARGHLDRADPVRDVPTRRTGHTVSIARYPEIMLALMERIEARARRLAVTQAISQMTGVDHRLETLFWHLADSWGKVRHDGVLIPLDLSHQLLGKLIGARRPTVSTALALLAHEQRVTRCRDGSWLLHRTDTPLDEPLEISLGAQPASWHRVAA